MTYETYLYTRDGHSVSPYDGLSLIPIAILTEEPVTETYCEFASSYYELLSFSFTLKLSIDYKGEVNC